MAVLSFLQGTPWKEERSADLFPAALGAGFRGFDTANQPRHNDEEAAGRALAGSSRTGRHLGTGSAARWR